MHFGNKEMRKVSSPEWLRAGSQIANIANLWANRGDLIVLAGPHESAPAPALFNPLSAEIEINTDVAFGTMVKPEEVGDLSVRKNQYEFPKATGAIFHEALHARYSRWNLEEAFKALKPVEYKFLVMLEESRIESIGVKTTPQNQIFLRSSALELALADMNSTLDKLTTAQAIGSSCCLVLARVDAGVLEPSDVENVRDVIVGQIGEELLEELRQVWIEFQSHLDHSNSTKLQELAKKFVELLSKISGSDESEEGGESGESGEGGKSGESGLSEEAKQIIGELIESIQDASDTSSLAVNEEVSDQQTAEEWKEIATSKSQKSQQKKKNEAVAKEIFKIGEDEIGSTGSSSQLISKRAPTAQERAAAVKIGQMLEKAKYRERSETTIKSITPPGRLRTNALVQGAALRAKGVMQQSEAWKRKVRKHTDDPTLTVGVLVDISGSMRAAMEPMAISAWVMSEATNRVQGKSAMVYYGSGVFPTLKPGQRLREVNIYSAPDNTENFEDAFSAIDGSLNLLYGTGARLLVIVSDGQYKSRQIAAAKKAIEDCKRNGVGVLWLNFSSHDYYIKQLVQNNGEIVSVDADDPTKATLAIGQSATKALMAVSLQISGGESYLYSSPRQNQTLRRVDLTNVWCLWYNRT